MLYELELSERNNKSIIDSLEMMSKLLYDFWFVQFDFPNENGKPYKSSGGKMVWNEELKKEVPDGWNSTTLRDFSVMYQPKTFDAKLLRKTGKYRVYGAGGYMGQYDEYNHENSEIFISCRGSCGNIYRSMPQSLITGNAMIVHPADELYAEYLYLTLKTFGVQNCITGSVQPQITRDELNIWKLIKPDPSVIKLFNNIAHKINDLIMNSISVTENVNMLRDFLLPMLTNGQVKVGGSDSDN